MKSFKTRFHLTVFTLVIILLLYFLIDSFINPDLEMNPETIWKDRWETLTYLITIGSTGAGMFLIKKNENNAAKTKEKLIGVLLVCFGFALMGLTILINHRKITKEPVEITYFMSSIILLLSVFGFIVILKKLIKKEY